MQKMGEARVLEVSKVMDMVDFLKFCDKENQDEIMGKWWALFCDAGEIPFRVEDIGQLAMDIVCSSTRLTKAHGLRLANYIMNNCTRAFLVAWGDEDE